MTDQPSIFMPPDSEVTPLGREYLEARVASMRQVIDCEGWRQYGDAASRREYWEGRLHEAQIALANLTNGMEKHGDGFVRRRNLDR